MDRAKAAASPAAAFVSAEWIVLALISPLFVFPPTGRLALTLIMLLPLAWFQAARRGEILPVTPLNGSLVVFVLAVGISLFASFDILFSTPKVLGVVFGIAVFFAIARAARNPETLVLLLRLFSLAGGVLAIIGLLGTEWIHKIIFLRSITARLPAVIRGVPGQAEGFQPNAVAGALVMFIPLQFALAMRDTSRRYRMLQWALLFITGSTLLLTQSRGGYLSLAAGFFAWALCHSRKSRVAVVAATAILILVLLPFRHRVAPLVFGSVGAGVATDVETRFELWSRALTMIADFPLTGVGMNGFRRVMPVMYPALLTPAQSDVAHAHNHLLQAALDIGLPGLVAYLALWCGAAALLLVAHRRAGERRRWIVSGMSAGMTSYFLFGTADAIALGAKVGIFFWVALGLIVGLRSAGR